jgi:hypothetical protein
MPSPMGPSKRDVGEHGGMMSYERRLCEVSALGVRVWRESEGENVDNAGLDGDRERAKWGREI